jgi:uncharacterized protein (TIGR03000 family)
MFPQIPVFRKLAAVAVLGAIIPTSVFAQQGEHLYDWSGGWGRSGRSFYAPPVPAPVPPVVPSANDQSFYPGEGPSSDRPALINVSVPAGADIWFGDTRMTMSGIRRQFVSPPITPGSDYVYVVRATWTEAGKNVAQSRRVLIHAGDVVNVTFSPRDMSQR